MNAVEIEEAVSDLAAQPFDRAEFPFQFLAAFGNKDTTLKKLRAGASSVSDVPGAVLQRNNIHLVTCDTGEVDAGLTALRDSPKTATAKVKFILATDGETIAAEEVGTDSPPLICAYTDLPNRFGFFLALAGITTVRQIKESSFDIRATGRLNKLYVELLKDNPDWAAPERRPDINHFMARLIFCFFAEDTDIFNGEGLFTRTIDQFSDRDSTNTHQIIANIFRAMNTKLADRAANGTPPHADVFPYVNGGLFSGSAEAPRFSKVARTYLLNIGTLDWKRINPDIFGSMIQAVADDDERGALGMHYTSVPNILKVLNPLFLDDLRAQLEEAGDSPRKLANLRARMARIRVFDPACGSGNFLVIAYKEMRAIEAQINKRRGEPDRRTDIPLTNFRGIELRDFPAEIARLALIIAEYQCDVLYRGQKEALAEFLPLNAQNWITCGNALRLDWLSICPPTGTGVRVQADDLFGTPLEQAEIDFENEGGETYICGNPPYAGSQWRTPEQQEDMDRVFTPLTKSYKDLDYVAAWFIKAAVYGRSVRVSVAFVATKSINQGRQVGMLWPAILRERFEIFFGHTPFRWRNLASQNAGVTVVIVGFTNVPGATKRIFEDDTVRQTDNINAYLLSGPDVIVVQSSRSLNGLPTMDYGNKPADGGHLILEPSESKELIIRHPEAKSLIRRFIGAREFTSSSYRYCLWISDSQLPSALAVPEIAYRINAVRSVRLASKGEQSNKNSDAAHRFVYAPHQEKFALVVPSITSENRPYLPVGFVGPDIIASNKTAVIYGAPLWTLSIVASRLHLQWIGTVCVRMRTDFSYSNTLGWNTFPLPQTGLTEGDKADLTRCAEDILLAREQYFPATIADMYDPDRMDTEFPLVRAAHDRNDETLERIYIGRRFRNDTERLEKLFELYTKMTAATDAKRNTVRKK